jgi:hypothetical protein
MRQAHGRAAAALGKAPHDSWAAAAAVASVGSAAAGQALENYGATHSHYSAMTGNIFRLLDFNGKFGKQ